MVLCPFSLQTRDKISVGGILTSGNCKGKRPLNAHHSPRAYMYLPVGTGYHDQHRTRRVPKRDEQRSRNTHIPTLEYAVL